MTIEIKQKSFKKPGVKMAKLRSGCTCWGPWYKDR